MITTEMEEIWKPVAVVATAVSGGRNRDEVQTGYQAITAQETPKQIYDNLFSRLREKERTLKVKVSSRGSVKYKFKLCTYLQRDLRNHGTHFNLNLTCASDTGKIFSEFTF